MRTTVITYNVPHSAPLLSATVGAQVWIRVNSRVDLHLDDYLGRNANCLFLWPREWRSVGSRLWMIHSDIDRNLVSDLDNG
ncbi:hypothetical protein CJF32_00002800 [Rutstroemia sp. NJR-2017a WRK4]|nr:hypothetical protein CJF32_00002800 [Rutstroemia sp. NJR-2017a WRK4]